MGRFVVQVLAVVTAVVGNSALAQSPSGPPVTRSQAIAIVTSDIIAGSFHEQTLRAYAQQTTVSAGAILGEAPDDTLAIVGSESWFVWMDLLPAAGFAHPTKFVLVSATTGTIDLEEDAEFWPYVDGIPPYLDQLDRDTSPDLFWDGAPVPTSRLDREEREVPGEGRRQGRTDPWLETLRRPVPELLAGTWGAIICPYDTSRNADLAISVRELAEAFDSLGIAAPTVTTDPSAANVRAALGALPDSCDKLYVAWVGHGSPNSLATGDGGSIGHKELACSLAAQNADEYCLVVDACFSGALLDDLTSKGVDGFHVVGCSDTSLVLRHIPGTRWKGAFGWWFTHAWTECIKTGLRGAKAFAWADSSVCAYKDSIAANGSACADSTAWAPYAGDPDNAKPTGSYVNTFDEVGAGSAGVPFCFEISRSCSTTCIMFPGSTGSDTCANFTVSCQAANGTDTTWVNAGSHNWNKGKTRYFRTFGVPNATGNYKIVAHSNKPAGKVQVTWLRGTSQPVSTPSTTFNAHSVGWTDGSSLEFNEPLGQGTNGAHFFGWFEGAPYDQIPAFTGPEWFRQVAFDLPLDPDPARPELYNGFDPNQGYADGTILLLQVADLRDPFGGPGNMTNVRVVLTQPFSGYFNQFDFPVFPGSREAGGFSIPIPLDLGTIFPEPLAVDIEVFGPDVIEWDSIVLMPFTGFDPTDAPEVARPVFTDRLFAAWPNPFRAETSIGFELGREQSVGVRVFDVAGRLVRTLAAEPMPAGPHTLHWDGRTDDGGRVTSGVYFYRLETAVGRETKKVVLVR